MKFTLALAFVCVAVTAVCGSTELQSPTSTSVKRETTTPDEHDLSTPVLNDLTSPVKYILNVGTPIARNSLLHRYLR